MNVSFIGPESSSRRPANLPEAEARDQRVAELLEGALPEVPFEIAC